MKKLVNGVEVELSAAEIEAYAIAESQWAALSAATAPIRAIAALEQGNPFPHRGEREFKLTVPFILRSLRDKINALDVEIAALADRPVAPLPPIPESHMERTIKAVDDAIKVERAKL